MQLLHCAAHYAPQSISEAWLSITEAWRSFPKQQLPSYFASHTEKLVLSGNDTNNIPGKPKLILWLQSQCQRLQRHLSGVAISTEPVKNSTACISTDLKLGSDDQGGWEGRGGEGRGSRRRVAMLATAPAGLTCSGSKGRAWTASILSYLRPSSCATLCHSRLSPA